MSTLDCTTERGQVYMAHSEDLLTRMAAKFGAIGTSTRVGIADIDAVFTRDNVVVGVAELKARNMSLDELRRLGSYLVTFDKLVRGAAVSKALQVPFILGVKLIKDDCIVFWNITDAAGAWVTRASIDITDTQATCNGGTATRANAYLPFINAHAV